ncbi:cleavage and polyadenylation specificity factor subunit 2 [Actinomortierella ambigua]|uniref:Cleavage and polyadenylation specificity factor subunit 2 n=1 Tax=Actinomortierella ambigua TaxID=1343610 RepID=A0A9P6U217_9FUNG|nr:cleavage and polyadenylation specificity factor subunit 2 [Actinomortierella ambigua]
MVFAESSIIRDDREFVKPKPRVHNQRLTIQHWQLRDLITCPNSRDEFIYVNGNSVHAYNTRSALASPLMKDLPFHPTSLTASCGYLAAGGQRSQLMVRQLNSNWCAHTSVGGSINNALCISEHLGGTRLLISNNDETIKVYSLPGLEPLTSIKLPVAVNYASVSPDGRKMVAVGDSNEVFLFDISVAAGYHKIGTYTATQDASFSCAWNQFSDKFAVASQDGFVSVWDVRHSEKLCTLGSKQHPPGKGSTRCVKFSSSGSVDLLVYSEHVSNVNLVDARSFNDRQIIRVAPPNADEHITDMESNYIRFTALSGAKSEAALCYLLEIDEAKILLDCGWNDAFDVEDLKHLRRIAKDVDACLLSHATLQHLGALPYAKSYLGLRAQTYSTIPVKDMGHLTLYDAWQSKRAVEDFKVFNLEDIDQAFDNIVRLRYHQPTELGGKCKGITITAYAGGHTVGGTVWKIVKDTESILYAVDYNHSKDKHLDGTVLLGSQEGLVDDLRRPSLMITDAFNAGEKTLARRIRDQALLESTMATLAHGGSVLLPTDSSARVLELAYMLDNHWMQERLPFPLILLTNFSYRTAHFATSMMEWMGEAVRKKLAESRENPFEFKYLRLCQRLSDLDKYPGPKVVLASNLSMETGFAREVFLKLDWAKQPRNTLILTERALPGELARFLYDRWREAVVASHNEGGTGGAAVVSLNDVGDEVKMDCVLRMSVKRKVPLEGQELADYLAAEQARLEREAAEKVLMERNRRTLMEEENDSEDEDSMDDDHHHAEVDFLLTTSGSHDVYMKDATKSGGFFKQTQSYRMFPFVERRKKIDDYGESISVEHFLSATSIGVAGAGVTAGPGGVGPGEHGHRLVDANGDLRMLGQNDDDDMMGTDNQNADGVEDVLDQDMLHPEDNVPSKYVVAEEDVAIQCKIRYIDLEGRSDERAMTNILQTIAPRKLILVHGTAAKTEALCEKYLDLQDMTREIYTPVVGEMLNVSEVTNMYKINLTDALLSSVVFSKLGDYDLAYLVGQVQIPPGASGPVLGLPSVEPRAIQAGAPQPPPPSSSQQQQKQPLPIKQEEQPPQPSQTPTTATTEGVSEAAAEDTAMESTPVGPSTKEEKEEDTNMAIDSTPAPAPAPAPTSAPASVQPAVTSSAIQDQQQQQQQQPTTTTITKTAATATAVATTTRDHQLEQQQQQLELLAREHKPVFVGDVKLTEFKNTTLRHAGIQAEFLGNGVLVCNGVVAIRKVDETGQILLEGSPLSMDYYRVRELLYSQFAIL